MAPAKTPAQPTKPTPSQKATQTVAAKAETKATDGPKVVYPEVKFEICNGDKAITMERAKELLGWETESDYVAKLKAVDANLNEDEAKKIFAKDKFLTDMLGNNVALRKNTHNRPWGEAVTNAYTQDLLKKHWEFNGETIIIGRFGNVLSGQHRLIAEVFAEQKRTRDKDGENVHWAETWTGPVTMPCCIVYGIDESSKVTRTIDNVKSRTLTDVVCADTDLFGGVKVTDRKSYARCLEYAVKFLWERVQVGDTSADSWAPKRTHSEALAFVDQHPKLKECVKFIMDEERGAEGRISRYIYPGYAAALMYMQSVVGTDEKKFEDYAIQRPHDEKHLKFPSMKKAKQFWSELAKADSSMMKVILAACPVRGNETDTFTGRIYPSIINDKRVSGDGSLSEQLGILIKAWNAYAKDEPLENLELTYAVAVDPETNKNVFELKEFPTIQNSIDQGKKQRQAKKKEEKPVDTAVTDAMNALEELSDTDADKVAADAQQTPVPTLKQQWDNDKATYAGHVLIYQSTLPNSDNYIIMFEDAELWGKVCEGTSVSVHPTTGIPRVVINEGELHADAQKMIEAGNNLLIFARPDVEGKREVSPYATPDATPDEENTEEVLEDITEVNPEEGVTAEPEPTPAPAPAPRVVIKKK